MIYSRLDMFVTIQHHNILRANLEADDGAILGLPLIESMTYGQSPGGFDELLVLRMVKTYLRKPFTFGTWLMLPMKGIVDGPGGKFRGRQLAR